MKNKTIIYFVFISHNLTAPNNFQRQYYERVYPEYPGYYMPKHYMEIPLWIAEISGMLPDEYYEKHLHIVTNLNETCKFFQEEADQNAIIMMSVMEVNKKQIKFILERTFQWAIIGGYIDPIDEFGYMAHVRWLDSPDQLDQQLSHVDKDSGPDYSLFQNEWVIPRLSLSDGCLFDCTFCTIPRVLTEYSWHEIKKQISSFKNLNFKLVYVNDKTFAQASNWGLLRRAGEEIFKFNEHFLGFIVQTTVTYAAKYFRKWYDEYFVAYMEVGVEAPYDPFLESMQKPYRMRHLDKLIKSLREDKKEYGNYRMQFIPNLLIGLPDYNHRLSVNWVLENQDVIAFVNPFILCKYENAHWPGWLENGGGTDANENVIERSWLSNKEQQWALEAMLKIFEIMEGKYVRVPRVYSV